MTGAVLQAPCGPPGTRKHTGARGGQLQHPPKPAHLRKAKGPHRAGPSLLRDGTEVHTRLQTGDQARPPELGAHLALANSGSGPVLPEARPRRFPSPEDQVLQEPGWEATFAPTRSYDTEAR